MTRKTAKSDQESQASALAEALEVKALVRDRLDTCIGADLAKFVDAYARAANVVRAFEKDRKRALREFTDDELAEYIRSLPERRRDALLVAVQGTSLNGKPLF